MERTPIGPIPATSGLLTGISTIPALTKRGKLWGGDHGGGLRVREDEPDRSYMHTCMHA